MINEIVTEQMRSGRRPSLDEYKDRLRDEIKDYEEKRKVLDEAISLRGAEGVDYFERRKVQLAKEKMSDLKFYIREYEKSPSQTPAEILDELGTNPEKDILLACCFKYINGKESAEIFGGLPEYKSLCSDYFSTIYRSNIDRLFSEGAPEVILPGRFYRKIIDQTRMVRGFGFNHENDKPEAVPARILGYRLESSVLVSEQR